MWSACWVLRDVESVLYCGEDRDGDVDVDGEGEGGNMILNSDLWMSYRICSAGSSFLWWMG